MVSPRELVAGIVILVALISKISLGLDLAQGNMTPGHFPRLEILTNWFVQSMRSTVGVLPMGFRYFPL